MYDEVIYFCSYEDRGNTDEFGDPVQTEVISEPVFARLKSIGQSEFYQAQTSGDKPEIKFVISDYLDYGGQQFVIHNDTRYKVLRTYRKDDNELEITCYGGVRDVSTTISDEG